MTSLTLSRAFCIIITLLTFSSPVKSVDTTPCANASLLYSFPVSDYLRITKYENPCSSKCGKIAASPITSSRVCSCDEECLVYEDCCYDFKESCPEVHLNATRLKEEHFRNDSKISCTEGYRLVSSCPASWEDGDIRNSCMHNLGDKTETRNITSLSEAMKITPVTGNKSKFHYRNVYCALCNGERSVTQWELKFACRGLESDAKENIRIDTLIHADNFIKWGCQHLFDSHVYVSKAKYPRKCRDTIQSCSPDCHLEEAKSLCENTYGPVICQLGNDSYVYDNLFCAYCNGVSQTSPSPSCRKLLGSDPWIRGFSFSIVFDLKSDKSFGADIGMTTNDYLLNADLSAETSCDVNSKCVITSCPYGYNQRLTECKIQPLYIGILNILEIYVGSYLPISAFVNALKFSLSSYQMDGHPINTQLWGTFDKNSSCIEDLSKSSLVLLQQGENIVYFGNYIKTDIVTYNTFLQVGSLLHVGTKMTILNNILSSHFGGGVNVTRYTTSQTISIETSFCGAPKQDKTQTCSYVVFNKTQWGIASLKEGVIWVSNNELKYSLNESQVTFTNLTVTACKSDLTTRYFEPSFFELSTTVTTAASKSSTPSSNSENLTRILSIVNYVILSLSTLLVLTRICLQFFIKTFNNMFGIMQFMFAIALFVFLVFFIIAGAMYQDYVSNSYIVPITLISIFAYLAVFWILNASNVHLYKTICQPIKSRELEHKPVFIRFALHGLIPPVLLISCISVLQYVDTDDNWHPNIGQCGGWICKNNPLITFTFVPIGVTILTNVILFVLIFVSLKRSYKSRERMTDTKRKTLSNMTGLAVRLSILMGLVWVIGILDVFIDNLAVSILTLIVLGGQGILLFFITSCSSSVRKEYPCWKQKKRHHHLGTSTSSGQFHPGHSSGRSVDSISTGQLPLSDISSDSVTR